jgi:hypothetical protein
MASNWTNRGRYKALEHVFRGAALPTNFFVALITNAAVPTVDTNTLGELTQIASGNGYTTNGISLTKNATDFDVLTEDDTNDRALIQIKDLVWTASGAYYAVLTDDNATPANRLVYAFHDLVGPISVSSGQPLTVQDIELRLA